MRIDRIKATIESPKPNHLDPECRDVTKSVPDIVVRVQGGQPVGVRTNKLEIAAIPQDQQTSAKGGYSKYYLPFTENELASVLTKGLLFLLTVVREGAVATADTRVAQRGSEKSFMVAASMHTKGTQSKEKGRGRDTSRRASRLYKRELLLVTRQGSYQTHGMHPGRSFGVSNWRIQSVLRETSSPGPPPECTEHMVHIGG
jgi:hypothetical protein